MIFNGGQRTLEADVEKIDTAKRELSNEYDPLFRLHREKFDQTGAKNLLVNVLHIDKGLNFQFDSELAFVNERVLYCNNKQEEYRLMQKARNWAYTYIKPCMDSTAKDINMY